MHQYKGVGSESCQLTTGTIVRSPSLRRTRQQEKQIRAVKCYQFEILVHTSLPSIISPNQMIPGVPVYLLHDTQLYIMQASTRAFFRLRAPASRVGIPALRWNSLPVSRPSFASLSQPMPSLPLIRWYGAATQLSYDEVRERVLNVVKAFDKVDAEKVTPESSFQHDLGIDSLDAVELVMVPNIPISASSPSLVSSSSPYRPRSLVPCLEAINCDSLIFLSFVNLS